MRLSPRERLFYRLSTVSLVLAHVSVLYLLLGSLFPGDAFEIKGEKLRLIERQIPSGARLRYILDYCKYQDTPAWVAREFVGQDQDGVELITQLPVVMSSMPLGCRVVEVSELVPPLLPPGTYRMRVTRIFNVTPLRTQFIPSETEEFEVLPAK